MHNALPKLSHAIFVAAFLANTPIFVQSQHLNQFAREAMQGISADSLYQHLKFYGKKARLTLMRDCNLLQRKNKQDEATTNYSHRLLPRPASLQLDAPGIDRCARHPHQRLGYDGDSGATVGGGIHAAIWRHRRLRRRRRNCHGHRGFNQRRD